MHQTKQQDIINIFWDTDIFIDLLYGREPFYSDAFEVLQTTHATHLVLDISVINYAYIVKLKPKDYSYLNEFLKQNFTIISANAKLLHLSLNLKFKDLEDSVQYLTAIEHNAQVFITRNTRHFKKLEDIIASNKEQIIKVLTTQAKSTLSIPEILTPKQFVKSA